MSDDQEAFVPLKLGKDGRTVTIPVRIGRDVPCNYDNAIREADMTRRVQAAFAANQPRLHWGWKAAGVAFIIGSWECGCWIGRLILGAIA